MPESVWRHWFDPARAFDEPAVVVIVGLLVGALAVAPVGLRLLERRKPLDPALRADLASRYWSWLVMVPVIVAPVLLGASWTIAAVGLLSILSYREFARVTGLFRERVMSLVVVVGIALVTVAVADRWYGFFMALGPEVLILIAAASTALDRPKGYLQRVSLAVFAFLLFGLGLGHLGYMANEPRYRAVVLMLVFAVEMNDVFAYASGKTLGGPKLAPATSPNKTISGSLGALLLTTLTVYALSGLIFREGPLSGPVQRVALGMLISITGQFGDLTLSSIKRDIGVKDTGSFIPGHGGVLDRANSLLFSAPAVFHYLNVFGAFSDAPPLHHLYR